MPPTTLEQIYQTKCEPWKQLAALFVKERVQIIEKLYEFGALMRLQRKFLVGKSVAQYGKSIMLREFDLLNAFADRNLRCRVIIIIFCTTNNVCSAKFENGDMYAKYI